VYCNIYNCFKQFNYTYTLREEVKLDKYSHTNVQLRYKLQNYKNNSKYFKFDLKKSFHIKYQLDTNSIRKWVGQVRLNTYFKL